MIPDWVPTAAWDGYCDMRKKLRKPMTDRAVQLRIKDLQKFMDEGQDIEAILDQSTSNSWVDLYPLKQKQTSRQVKQFDNSRLGKHGQATANNALDWLEGR